MSDNPRFLKAISGANENGESELARLADVGELAGPLAHEFNNYLNCVLLHIAVLESEAPTEGKSEWEAVRQLSTTMAALVAQFQAYRRRGLALAVENDLNAAALRAATGLAKSEGPESAGSRFTLISPSGEATLTLQLAAGVLLVPVSTSDLERLVLFLVSNAVAAASPGRGTVTVRTEQTDRHVLLSVEDTGPSCPPSTLPRFFDLTTTPRPGTHVLELAACKSIVNRTGGKILAVNLPETGLAVRVRWEWSIRPTPGLPGS